MSRQKQYPQKYFRTMDNIAQMNSLAGEDDEEIDTSSNVLGGSAAKTEDRSHSRETEYVLAEYGYGKNDVKLLKVEREGSLHHIREYEVSTHLRLESNQDFLQGDNTKIIATDTQKNTVYLLARKYGIKSPEAFGLQLCSHFLYLYPQVVEVSVHVEEYPWQRLLRGREKHNHAFVFAPVCYRSCTVSQARNEAAHIQGRIEGLRLLKTTQSSFTDFVQDEYRTLPDQNDRVFSTVVRAEYIYNTVRNVDFDRVWKTVKECIIEQFAGDTKTGIFSPSVQNTLYLTAKSVLDKVDEIQSIKLEMPNKHYNYLDLSKFANIIKGSSDDHEVYQPVDKPAGMIHAELERGKVVPEKSTKNSAFKQKSKL